MTTDTLKKAVLKALDDIQAIDIITIDVKNLTSITDYMIITSGRSTRHIKSIADHVVEASKKQGITPLSVEGEQGSEWVLVDLGDIVIHAMQPAMREYYQLEKLWAV